LRSCIRMLLSLVLFRRSPKLLLSNASK